MSIEFFKNQKNLNNINCFSDEGNKWHKTNLEFKNQTVFMKFNEKFTFRRGRINCSLNDEGEWRWLGMQFTINKNLN